MKPNFAFRFTRTALVLFFLLAFGLSTQGAIFIKIPDIEGESQASEHEGEIDVYGWSWGLARPLDDASTGSGRTRAAVQFEDIKIRKRIDQATPLLMLGGSNGHTFDEVIMTVRKDSGDAHLDYLKITMTNVIITSVSVGKTQDDGVPVEEVAFAFEAIEMEYTPSSASSPSGPAVEYSWNLETASTN